MRADFQRIKQFEIARVVAIKQLHDEIIQSRLDDRRIKKEIYPSGLGFIFYFISLFSVIIVYGLCAGRENPRAVAKRMRGINLSDMSWTAFLPHAIFFSGIVYLIYFHGRYLPENHQPQLFFKESFKFIFRESDIKDTRNSSHAEILSAIEKKCGRSDLIENISDDIICCISRDIITTPSFIAMFNSSTKVWNRVGKVAFEKKNLNQWLEKREIDPLTNINLSGTTWKIVECGSDVADFPGLTDEIDELKNISYRALEFLNHAITENKEKLEIVLEMEHSQSFSA